MSMRFKVSILFALVLLLPLLVMVTGLLTPPDINFTSTLVPILPSGNPDYSIDEETGAFIFDIGGSAVQVISMTEQALNALFPTESAQGMYSTNPYTYGNWVDPNLGYIPIRFTTFQVSLLNRNFAKMKIDPVEAVLLTDQGELFHSYTFSVAAAKYGNSFEDYYRTRRGMSGNDYYRYEMELGMVRGKNFGLDEVIFRGDSYTALITFDPLRDDVQRIQLQINDIIYRFDAFNRPVDVTTANFTYNRKIDRQVITQAMKKAEIARQRVRVNTSGNKQLVNNRTNDNARSEYTVDQAILKIMPQMEQCFLERYRKNDITPGSMQISFTIANNGTISSQNVIQVNGISNESFMNCVLGAVKGMKFDAIQDLPLTGTNIVKGPAEPVNVLYPLVFQTYLAN